MKEVEKVFQFEYQGITYYYNRIKEPERVRVEKDKEGKPEFIGLFDCPRCSGKGSSWWNRDNGICYLCHGLGYTSIKLNVTKNKGTVERRIQANIEKKEREQTEAMKQQLEKNLQKSLDTYGESFYLILNTEEHSTYLDRMYLKMCGARWNPDFNSWWIKDENYKEKVLKDYKIIEMKTRENMNEYNVVVGDNVKKVVTNYNKELEDKKGDVIYEKARSE